ncbi:MAG TPA: MerR family transcriptional regulator, partial [Zoogloea sp.]|nr:MerR family transcriptional regulator [Zoogloea sp.]
EADIVALSFSIAHPLRPALDGLRALREALPAKVDLWVGGAGVCGRQDRLPGIRVIERIEDCVDALGVWRAAHPA